MHLRIANPNMLLWPPPLAPQALLERDPGLRPTVAQCLEHPWITQFSDTHRPSSGAVHGTLPDMLGAKVWFKLYINRQSGIRYYLLLPATVCM